MTMGYAIEINETAAEFPCPLCGCWEQARPGLVVVQRPSGDIVCEECAKRELIALHNEVVVLQEDTRGDFPDVWVHLVDRLRRKQDPDYELGLLLESVGWQRYTGGGHEHRYAPEHPPIGRALGTIDRPSSEVQHNESVES